ncbi:universal stress protein [Leifsonia sp. NPDC058230]|uniref:universal stress protein n=1 Tax=Leifsonia sp. NPDC058230 TaxID=3346391 RepID=UPI0036D940B1
MVVSRASGPVVVGVYPGQATAVVVEAAQLAAEFGRALLCGYVTLDSYLTEWEKGDRRQASLHPVEVGRADEAVALELAGAITLALEGKPTLEQGWSLRILNGDPSQALSRLSDEVDARLVVVGTHGAGFSHALESWLAGSVATHLSRSVRCPVVVVPVEHRRGSGAPTLG